jgi:hypothetical protein
LLLCSEVLPPNNLVRTNELPNALRFASTVSPETRKYTSKNTEEMRIKELKGSAEIELLTSLLSTLDAATTRKRLLLDAIGRANSRLLKNGNFMSNDVRESIAWLKANLEQTNKVIDEALPLMRLMYGKGYLPSQATKR